MDEVMVTVVCLTYNHADYIRDALEGFVAQQAPWRIEVLVHDDASTFHISGLSFIVLSLDSQILLPSPSNFDVAMLVLTNNCCIP